MENIVLLVGQNIKKHRKEQSLTQQQLAEKCGFKTTYIAGVERGERNITLQSLEKISVGLNVAASELLMSSQDNSKIKITRDELFNKLNEVLEKKSDEEIQLIFKFISDVFIMSKK